MSVRRKLHGSAAFFRTTGSSGKKTTKLTRSPLLQDRPIPTVHVVYRNVTNTMNRNHLPLHYYTFTLSTQWDLQAMHPAPQSPASVNASHISIDWRIVRDGCLSGTGVQFIRDCPREPHIPVYMVVGGTLGGVRMFWTLYSQVRSRRPEVLSVPGSRPPISPTKLASVALSCFLVGWFALGKSCHVFVFSGGDVVDYISWIFSWIRWSYFIQ